MDKKEIEKYEKLSKEEKLKKINEVLDKEVRPFIAMDRGGVIVLDIQNCTKVLIKYEGACVGCPAATGSTLASIQHALRELVHPDIEVIPQF